MICYRNYNNNINVTYHIIVYKIYDIIYDMTLRDQLLSSPQARGKASSTYSMYGKSYTCNQKLMLWISFWIQKLIHNVSFWIQKLMLNVSFWTKKIWIQKLLLWISFWTQKLTKNISFWIQKLTFFVSFFSGSRN